MELQAVSSLNCYNLTVFHQSSAHRRLWQALLYFITPDIILVIHTLVTSQLTASPQEAPKFKLTSPFIYCVFVVGLWNFDNDSLFLNNVFFQLLFHFWRSQVRASSYDSNNSPTRCNGFTSLLLVYVWLNMFQASPLPPSGAYSCTRSL